MGTTLSISAGDLHKILLQRHAIGNLARRRFADALRALSEEKLYRKLGFSTIVSYAETTFGYAKSAIYELLRVSEKFTSLEKIAGAFEEGKLSWNLAADLTRVATPSSEETWIGFAEKHKPAEVIAEVKEAILTLQRLISSGRRSATGIEFEDRGRVLHSCSCPTPWRKSSSISHPTSTAAPVFADSTAASTVAWM